MQDKHKHDKDIRKTSQQYRLNAGMVHPCRRLWRCFRKQTYDENRRRIYLQFFVFFSPRPGKQLRGKLPGRSARAMLAATERTGWATDG